MSMRDGPASADSSMRTDAMHKNQQERATPGPIRQDARETKSMTRISGTTRSRPRQRTDVHARHSHAATGKHGRSLRPHPLSWSILIALGAATGSAQADTALGIVTDGRTQTQLIQTTPGVVDIHTGTVRGANAFNSFHHFQVAETHTANLYLPQQTSNLINLVHDSRVAIHGTLNSYQDGVIGGNVVFADPHGFLVSATGQVNVGSLAVATPTTGFMQQIIAPDGTISDSHVARLLDGDVPVSPDGLISIQGRVEAQNLILFHGHAVDIAGHLNTRLADTEHEALFQGAVNVSALRIGTDIEVADGDIVIVARDEARISGEIDARGRDGRSGGSVLITAGGSVTLESGSQLDASGRGSDSAGGTIVVYGEERATLSEGATVRARGGDSGDGGFVEISARHTVTLEGGSVDVGATEGAGGRFLIDPDHIEVSGRNDFEVGEALWIADESIVVRSGAVINTRTVGGGVLGAARDVAASIGDSGAITLVAPNITVEQDAALLAFADNGHAGGKITLDASQTDATRLGVASAAARIDVHGTLRGGEIVLAANASATVSDSATDTNQLRGLAVDLLQGLLDEIPAFDVGFGIADTSAEIVVHDSAILEASGDLTIAATATRDVSLSTEANGDLAGVAAIYGELKGRTAAQIAAGADVRAGDTLAVRATSDNTLALDAATRAGDNDTYFAGTLAIGIAKNLETVADAHLTAPGGTDPQFGALLVEAVTHNDFSVTAHNEASPGGSVGLAAAVLDTATTSTARLDGSTRVAGDVAVIAETHTARRHAIASTGAPDGQAEDGDATAEGDSGGVADFITGFTGKQSSDIDDARDAPAGEGDGGLPLDLGAAVAVSLGASQAEAVVDGTVRAGGDLAVLAEVREDDVATHAIAGAVSAADGSDGNPLAIAAAVAVTDLVLDARAEIPSSATVEAGRIAVVAEVVLPARGGWGGEDGPGSLDDLTGEDAARPEDALSTYAGTSLETGSETAVSVGGAVNYVNVHSTATARIDGDATSSAQAGDGTHTDFAGREIAWDAAVLLRATNRVETVNLAGNVTALGSTVGVGGVFNWATSTVHTTAAIGGSGTVNLAPDSLHIEADGTHTLVAYASMAGSGDGGTLGLGAAGVYARLESTTVAEVEDGARIVNDHPVDPPLPADPKPRAVAILATGRNSLDVAAASSATGGATVGVSATVAYAEAAIDTRARLGTGDALGAGSLTVAARSDNDYSVTARAEAEGTAGLGIAAAIADVRSDTLALIARDVELDGGDVTVRAESRTTRLAVGAETSASDADDDSDEEAGDVAARDEGATALVTGKVGAASDGAEADGADAPGTDDSGGFPIKFGSAVAVTLAEENAQARIANDVTVSGGGDVLVAARRELHDLATHATSAAISQAGADADGESASGISVSAAVSVTLLAQRADALLGDPAGGDPDGTLDAGNLYIDAGRLRVAAELDMPARGEAPGIGDFGGEDADADALNGFASASVQGAGDIVSFAGSVNYLDVDSHATARIGTGATIALDGDAPAAADEDADRLLTFAGVLDVEARARVETITVAGNRAESGKVGIGGAFNWVRQDTHVVAELKQAEVNATGTGADLNVIAARSDRMVVLTPVSGEAGETVGVGAAVALGMLAGSARAELDQGTANLTTDGTLTVAAHGDTDTVVSASSAVSGSAKVGFSATVAYSELETSTQALARSATGGTDPRLRVGALRIEAADATRHSTVANAEAEGGAAVGIAAAVADLDATTTATLAARVESDGDVLVFADLASSLNEVEATTRAGDSEEADESAQTSGNDGGSTDFTRGKAEQGEDKLDGRMADAGDDQGAGGGDFSLKLGGALALNFTDRTVRATVEDDTDVLAGGDVAIVARIEDSGLRNWAEAGTISKSSDGGTPVSLGAAVAVGLYANTAEALVGRNVSIEAEHVGVGATVSLPLGASLDMWTDLDGWIAFFKGKPGIDDVDGRITDWAKAQIHTYASATAASEADSVTIAGAVNYVDFTNRAVAWVGEGSTLTAHAADDLGADGPRFTTELRAADPDDEDAEADTFSWARAVTVAAATHTATIDVAGNFDSLLNPGMSGDGGKFALGAAFNWVNHENTALAGVDAGTVITAESADVAVTAHAFDQVIAISPTSGSGSGIAGNGIVTLTRVDNQTHAAISNEATIRTRELEVDAQQLLSIWSVAGALTSADNAALGFAVAANDLNATTSAFVGDIARLDPLRFGSAQVRADVLDPAVQADFVRVAARTEGIAGTGALAGSLSGGSSEGESGDRGEGLGGRTTQALDGRSAAANAGADEATADDEDTLDLGVDTLNDNADASESAADQQNPDGPDAGGLNPTNLAAEDDTTQSQHSQQKSSQSFGLAVSGSATINLSDMTTRAWIEDADLAPLDAVGLARVDVVAVNDTDLISVSGAGALYRADKSGGSGNKSVAIAGAVAYNLLENTTEAAVRGSQLIDAGTVNVEAITSGDQIAVGLGLAVNTSAGDTKSASIAGSVSIARTRNETLATIEDSTIRIDRAIPIGHDATQDHVGVLAYDRSRIASGGGALALGGAVGVGAAVSVNLIGNTVDAAIVDAALTNVGNVHVQALTQNRILGLAAMVGVNKSGTAAIGGSGVFNRIGNDVGARIEDGTVLASVRGNVDVIAAGTSDDPALGTQAAFAGRAYEPGADFDGGEAFDPDYEAVEDGDALGDLPELPRPDGTGEAIIGVAGTLSVSGKAAIGLSFVGNWIESTYTAQIVDSSVDAAGTVTVAAADTAQVVGVAVGGGVATGKFAGVGSVVANVIRSEATATVVGKSRAEGDPDPVADVRAANLSIEADKTGRIYSVAGALAFGGKAGVGAAVGYNEITTTTRAGLDGALVVLDRGTETDREAQVSATSSSAIYGGAIMGAAAGKAALGGSVVINRIGQTVEAALTNGTVLDARTLTVQAGDGQGADIWALAGNIAGAGKAAIGMAVAYNEIGGWTEGAANRFAATIDGAELRVTDTLDVRAELESDVQTLAATGQFAGSVAAGGSVAVSTIQTRAEAGIANTTLNAGIGDPGAGTLQAHVAARDDSTIRAASGSLQGAGKAAFGLASTVNRIDTLVSASVSGGTLRVRDLVVDGYSKALIQTLAAGLAAGGKAGVAGSVSVNLVGTEVDARITNGADVFARNNVGVLAENRDTVQVIGGALGFGVVGGMAGSVAVNLIDGVTTAAIDGAATRVTALAEQDAALTVNSGRLANRPATIVFDAGRANESLDEYSGQVTTTSLYEVADREVHGLAVNATSTQHVAVAAGSVGIAVNPKGSVGLAATVNVNRIGGETQAVIDGATINADNGDAHARQQVDVKASSHAHTAGVVAGLGVGLVGIGGAAAVDLVDRVTVASIADAAVDARERVMVDARSTQGITAIAASGSAGAAALTGSAPVSVVDTRTSASVERSRIRAGDLSVKADSDSAFSHIAGALGFGGLAGAAAVSVIINEATTTAFIADAPHDVGTPSGLELTGDLSVEATTTTQVNNIAAGASLAGTALAGMASVVLVDTTTHAWLDNVELNHANQRARQAEILATDTLTVHSIAGGVALGGTAVSAAVNVLVGQSNTAAWIADSTINTTQAVTVAAERDWQIEHLTISGAVGGGIALSGGVGVILLGQGGPGADVLGGEIDRDDGSSLDMVDGAVTADNHLDPSVDMLSTDERTALSGVSRGGVGSAVRAGGDHAVTSGIHGSTVRAGSVSVTAESRTHTDTLVGAGAIGLSIAGVGGAVAVTRIANRVESVIEASTVQSAGSITVGAYDRDGAGGAAAEVVTWAGGASLGIGLGAAWSDVQVRNRVNASAGGDLRIGDGTLAITAEDTTSIASEANGMALGAAAAGVAVSRALKHSDVSAGIAPGATVGLLNPLASLPSSGPVAALDVSIHATVGGRISSETIGAAGGLLVAANAAVATAEERSTVVAEVGEEATIGADDAHHRGHVTLSVDAAARPNTYARAAGGAVSAGAGIGAAVAEATARTDVQAYVRSGATVYARELDIVGRVLVPTGQRTAQAYAIVGTGGLLLGANATVAKAESRAHGTAQVARGATIHGAETIEVRAVNNTRQEADAIGVALGLVAAGAVLADANAYSNTLAAFDGHLDSPAGTLTVTANGHDILLARTTSGSGGVLAGAAALSKTLDASRTHARIQGEGVSGTDPLTVGNLIVRANHLADFDGSANSVQASVAGASGAWVEHTIRPTVETSLGNGARVVASNIELSADNRAIKNRISGDNARGASGGVLNAAAVKSETAVTFRTRVRVGEGAEAAVIGNPLVNPGRILLSAQETVDLRDQTRLDTGGAVTIARAESLIRVNDTAGTPTDPVGMAILIGTGARLDSVGAILATTRMNAEIATSANAKTYGLAGAAQGRSESVATARQRIVVGSDAELLAYGDIRLMPGQREIDLTNISGSLTYLDLRANTDLFNKTAIPIPGLPHALAEARNDSLVVIEDGARVASVRDVHLGTRDAQLFVNALGVAKDLYRQAAEDIGNAIGGLVGADEVSLETVAGDSIRHSDRIVLVDGSAEAGIHNHQWLRIDFDSNWPQGGHDLSTHRVDEGNISEGVSFSVNHVSLVVSIWDRISELQGLMADHAGNGPAVAAYRAEIDRLVAQLATLNLNGETPAADGEAGTPLTLEDLENFAGNNDMVLTVIDLDPILASPGNVFVTADLLVGTGDISAPGDASILIDNYTPYYLRIHGMEIPWLDRGRLVFNNRPETTNAGIADRNRHPSWVIIDGYGRREAAFGTIETAATTADPLIRVVNHYDPDGALYDGRYRAPDIWVVGDLNNVGGLVALSSTGSVVVSAELNAGQLEIDAGLDFVLNYVPTFRHITGDPKYLWQSQAHANECVTGSGTNCEPYKGSSTSNIQHTSDGLVIAANNVYISARYLNINGTIRSGLPEWAIVLPAALDTVIADAQAAYDAAIANGHSTEGLRLVELTEWTWGSMEPGASTEVDILESASQGFGGARRKAWWNAEEQRIELDGVRVQGGYIELVGEMMSTGGGQLEVIDGFGSIRIVNETNHDLLLNTLDTGRGVEGTIRIVDLGIEDGKRLVGGVEVGDYRTTTYSRIGDLVHVVDNRTLDTDGRANHFVVDPYAGTTAAYSPTAGLRYAWVTGRGAVEKRSYYFEKKSASFFGLFDLDWIIPANYNWENYLDQWFTDNEPLLQGDFLARTGDLGGVHAGGGQYAYSYSQVSMSEWETLPGSSGRRCSSTFLGLCTEYTYWQWVERQRGVKDFYTHSVKADHDIAIRFTGFETGLLDITSDGRVLIGGNLLNESGNTSIQAAAIRALSDQYMIFAHDLDLVSTGGDIGRDGDPLHLRLSGTLSASSAGGNIHLDQLADPLRNPDGDLWIDRVEAAGGNVSLGAAGSILMREAGSLIEGAHVQLEARFGSVGTSDAHVRIDTLDGEQGLFDATAGNGVFVTQIDGDLNVRQIATDGDVHLRVANGSLIDANPEERRDDRVISALEQLWSELGLIDEAAAQASVDDTRVAIEGVKRGEYDEYWHLRGLRLEETSPGVLEYIADAYDADFVFAYSAQDRSTLADLQGLTGAQLDEMEESRTARYHDLHAAYGADAYDPLWSYTWAEGELDAIAEGHLWTRQQLEFAISSGLLEWTPGRDPRIQAPNIIGANIVLEVHSGTIGKILDDDVFIDVSQGLGALDPDARREALIALAAAEIDDIELGEDWIRITQLDNVVLEATGSITASARDGIYLGSTLGHDLVLDHVQGPIVRLTTPEGIEGVTDGRPVLEGGEVILEARDGHIGTPELPLHVAISEHLTARTGGAIHLVQHDHDLTIGRMFAPEGAFLEVLDGGVSGRFADGLAVNAGSLTIGASGGVGTSATDRLAIRLDAGGRLEITSGGDVFLLAPDAGLDEVWIDAAGRVLLGAAGDVLLESITAGAAGAGAVVVTSDGAIRGHEEGEEHDHIHASADDAGVELEAGTGIGDPTNPLRVWTAAIAAETLSGDIHLVLPRATHASLLTGPGLIDVDALDDLGFDLISGGTGIDLRVAGQLAGTRLESPNGTIEALANAGDIDEVEAEGDVTLTTFEDLRLGTVWTASDVELVSGGDLDFDNVIASGSARLRSYGDLDGGMLQIGEGLQIAVGTRWWDGASKPASIRLGTFGAKWAEFEATYGIEFGLGAVYDHLYLQADYIEGHVEHLTANGPALEMIVRGSSGEAATSAQLDVDAPLGLYFPVYAAIDSVLTTTARNVLLEEGFVPGQMEIFTPDAHLYMNNRTPAPVRASVQLHELDFRFFLEQNLNDTYTDSYIVWYAPGFTVRVPNYASGHTGSLDYEGTSVVRDSGIFAELQNIEATTWIGAPMMDEPAEDDDPLNTEDDFPVNLGTAAVIGTSSIGPEG